ncbi:MAG: PP2C family protein-serine/threonine phosphatase [Ignavibacteria bacterium]|nr:PP2C family protein-serine/threonine phosphatase [Ignavibacteria bacterium]
MDIANLLEQRRKSIVNLQSLLDLSTKLNELNDEQKILNASILSMMGKLKFSRAAAYIRNEECLQLAVDKGIKLLPEKVYFSDFKFSTLSNFFKKFQLSYIFPVYYKSELLAVFLLSSPLGKTELTDEELHYGELISQITANALQTTKYVHSLSKSKLKAERHSQMLSTVFEISRDFSHLLSREKIVKMLSYHLMGQLMVNRFALLQRISENNYEVLINRFNNSENISRIEIIGENQFVNVLEKAEFPHNIAELFPKAELLVPMIVQGETKGLLIVGPTYNSAPYDETKKLFITAIANTTITALENERLFQEELAKKAIESELAYALEIQKNLLPKVAPNIPNYSIYGRSIPSRQVGGDYFDYIMIDEYQLLVSIADVSGKGLPAALLMANFQSALRILASLELELNELVEKLNSLVYSNTSPDKFITFFVGKLDLSSNKFTYINAGHNPPMLYRNTTKEIELLRKGGLLLGCLDKVFNYEVGEIEFSEEDILVMFTDGVSEAQNKHGEEFTEAKLESIVKAYHKYNAELLVEKIISEVEEHSFKSSYYDDITIVGLKREK